jgi:hypothetical protein
MLQVFHMDVAGVLFECCKSISGMLYVLQWIHTYVTSICLKYFSYSRQMLQLFYLDVAK